MDLVDYLTGTKGLYGQVLKGLMGGDKKKMMHSSLERTSEIAISQNNYYEEEMQSFIDSEFASQA